MFVAARQGFPSAHHPEAGPPGHLLGAGDKCQRGVPFGQAARERQIHQLWVGRKVGNPNQRSRALFGSFFLAHQWQALSPQWVSRRWRKINNASRKRLKLVQVRVQWPGFVNHIHSIPRTHGCKGKYLCPFGINFQINRNATREKIGRV